jgi:ligand-binding sensor domain-containing protein
MFLRARRDAVRAAVSIVSKAFLILGFAASLSAQQLVFEEFGFAQGLGNSAINCLLEDRQGYLWVGTMSGLYRGDGERFVRFDQSSGLPDATIQSLAEDGVGRIWAATRSGVAWSADGRFHMVPFEQPVEIYSRRSIAIAPDGSVWAATSWGLFHLPEPARPGRAFRLQRLPGLDAGAAIDAVFLDHDGALWISARRQLWRWRNGTIEHWGPGRGVPPAGWSDFVRSPEGDLWVRAADRLLRIPANATSAEDRTGSLPSSGFFGSLALDRAGRLLVPTDNGLFVLSGGSWQSYGVAQGLPGQSISVAMQDREGSLWLGLGGLGLFRVAGYGVTETWTAHDGLGSSTVSAVAAEGNGRIWAGTDNGLAFLDPGAKRWNPLPARTGLCGAKVRALAVAGSTLYAGCFPGGVSRIDPRSLSARRLPGPDRINGMLVDLHGFLWVSSLEGLYRSDAAAAASSVRLLRIVPPRRFPGRSLLPHGERPWRCRLDHLECRSAPLAQRRVAPLRKDRRPAGASSHSCR